MKILVVLPRFPYPLEKGDKLRAYHQIRILSQRNEVFLSGQMNLLGQPEYREPGKAPELLSREWYVSCDLSKYIAYIIDTLNHDTSISDLLDPSERIQNLLARYKKEQAGEA